MSSDKNPSISLSNLTGARCKLKDLMDEIDGGLSQGTVQVRHPNHQILTKLQHAIDQIEVSINTSRSVPPKSTFVQTTQPGYSGSINPTGARTEDTTSPSTSRSKEWNESPSSPLSKARLFKALWDELTEEAYIRITIFSHIRFISVMIRNASGFDIEDKWYKADFPKFLVPSFITHFQDIPYLQFVGLTLSFFWMYWFNPINICYVIWRIWRCWPDDLIMVMDPSVVEINYQMAEFDSDDE